MKKITLKISAFLLLTMFSLQVQAQTYGEWTTNGIYKIGVPSTNYFMTVNGSTGNLKWAAGIAGNDPTQLWTITDHRTPASTGMMEIYATIPGLGNFTMTTNGVQANHPNYTLSVRAGDPISVTPLAEDYSGLDQFQRRKTTTASSGNDALFLRTPWGTNSRYGVAPTAVGDPVKFDGGGMDKLEFTLISTLSNTKFDASSIFISNPVKNQLNIKGFTGNVSKVSVFTLLGQEVLSRKIDAQSSLNIDLSTLTSGMYLVQLSGETGKFTKKIIKQ